MPGRDEPLPGDIHGLLARAESKPSQEHRSRVGASVSRARHVLETPRQAELQARESRRRVSKQSRQVQQILQQLS